MNFRAFPGTVLIRFENGGFTLKTHQMFSLYTTTGKCDREAISGYFGFVFEANHMIIVTPLFP